VLQLAKTTETHLVNIRYRFIEKTAKTDNTEIITSLNISEATETNGLQNPKRRREISTQQHESDADSPEKNKKKSNQDSQVSDSDPQRRYQVQN
jgi:hypothetical protein